MTFRLSSRLFAFGLAVALAAITAIGSVPSVSAQSAPEEDAWPELDGLTQELAAIMGGPEDKLAPVAQASSHVYEGTMKLQAQAVNFYGQPIGPSEHQVVAQIIIGPPAGTRASSGRESNEFNLSVGAKNPGQASPYDLWIKSADVFTTGSGLLMLQYWEYQLADTRDGVQLYRGTLVSQHMAEAAVWNQLMVPEQIYPNGPGMQFPQPLDEGSQIAIAIGDRAAAVAVRGSANHGKYPLAMELIARQAR